MRVPSWEEVARGLKAREDVRSHTAGVLGQRVRTGRTTAHVMVGRSGAQEAGRVSDRTRQLCRRAVGNMGPWTALPQEVLEGVVRPWWRGERRGEVREGDGIRVLLAPHPPSCTDKLLPLTWGKGSRRNKLAPWEGRLGHPMVR